MSDAAAPAPLSADIVTSAVEAVMASDAPLQAAAADGTLTAKMVRTAVAAHLEADGGARLKSEYKAVLTAAMIETAAKYQAPPAPAAEAEPEGVEDIDNDESDKEDDDGDDGGDDNESVDDDELARRERAPHKDDARVEALDGKWTALFGEVCWVASQGFKHWPSIIYDPRWTKGAINAQAMKHLGKRHCCVFYGMDASERFTFETTKNVVPWDEGLKRGLDKQAKEFKPKRYELAFPKAVAEAREEKEEDEAREAQREERLKASRASGVPVWKQMADAKASAAPAGASASKARQRRAAPPPPKAVPVHVPEDAAGLVAALRTSVVGAKKNPRAPSRS
ncbi:hypothetical protein JL722_10737 [Aureococcus anophagefferens]|nr:hypothetical protein JL722_10737 [Aureococcus anophagefferens]